jgi:hypothetical protein
MGTRPVVRSMSTTSHYLRTEPRVKCLRLIISIGNVSMNFSISSPGRPSENDTIEAFKAGTVVTSGLEVGNLVRAKDVRLNLSKIELPIRVDCKSIQSGNCKVGVGDLE